jgi:hypothetical protein
MISITQLNQTQCLAMLRANPGLAIFPFPTQEFPLGVTRAALVAQFNAQAGNPANFDPIKGTWNCQRLELVNPSGFGLFSNALQITGLQVAQKYQVNENGNTSPSSLPGTAPEGVPLAVPGVGTNGAYNTGNFPNNPGEFSPAGTVSDVPPSTPTVGTPSATPTGTATVSSGAAPSALVSPGAVFGATGTMITTPSQVN